MNEPTDAFKTALFSPTVPGGLEERIMARITAMEKSRRGRRVAFGAALSGLCAAVLVLAGTDAFREMQSTGFSQYLSLIFTNGGAMFADWRDFAWTLVESLPAGGIAFFLGALALLLGALRWTIRRTGRLPVELAGYAL